MSKRFTDTEKWERPWFRKLPNEYKLLWCYVLDRCDIAGVWYVDMEMASFLIGSQIDRAKAEELFSKQIRVNDNRWLIVDFIPFQYGDLQESNKVFKSVSIRLASFKDGASMPHLCPTGGAKDKDKDGFNINTTPLKEGGSGGKHEKKERLKVMVEIPDDLIESESEIRDWLEYKKQKGQNYKPKGLEALWKTFRSIPASRRRESVDHSMSNNWSGLFEKRENGGTYGKREDGFATSKPGKYDRVGE